jgi:hypothetical protein
MAVRRDIFRDPDVTAGYAEKLGTLTARAFGLAVAVNINHLEFTVLLAAAHHADLMRVSGRNDPTYAADIADLVGCGPMRARDVLGDLKRRGLLVGSGHGGYRPSPLFGELAK